MIKRPLLPARRPWRMPSTLLALAGLSACQLNAGPAALPPALDTARPSGSLAAQQRWLVDVDPTHASAFERAEATGGPAAGQLPLVAYFPEVRHDLATGRTTVVVDLVNAGVDWAQARLVANSERSLALPLPGSEVLPRSAGEHRPLTLVFDNPAAESFSFQLGVEAEGAIARLEVPQPPTAPLGASWAGSLLAAAAPTATASSIYSNQLAANAVDGNLNSAWASGDEPSPSLTIDWGQVLPLAALSLKIAPFGGEATYAIDLASEPGAFQPVLTGLRSSSWAATQQALKGTASARYLRLRFQNSPTSPERRFSVFEVQAVSPGGPAPSPSPSASPSSAPSPSTTPSVTPTGTPSSAPTNAPSTAPTGAPSSSPSAAPSPTSGSYVNTFEAVPIGAAPTDFIDPRAEGYSLYDWMPAVKWSVQSVNGSKQYVHDGLADRAFLSFRRYKGNAFGPNGQLPAKYYGEVSVTSLQSYTYAPTGDQGTQFYYLDPTHYVELLFKPKLFEVWVGDDAIPFTSKGWSRLYYSNVSTDANQARKLSAAIDCNTKSIQVYLDGKLMTTLSHPMLSTAQPHYFSLRGTGNVVAHDDLRLEAR